MFHFHVYVFVKITPDFRLCCRFSKETKSSNRIFVGVSLGDSSSEVGESATESDCQTVQPSLSAFIKSYVAQAQLVESVGTEMTYVLPTGASHGSKFENLFDALNQNLERFNISSFGVSDTTLEEVSKSVKYNVLTNISSN